MSRALLSWPGVLVPGALGLALLYWLVAPQLDAPVFPDLQGPDTPTPVAAAAAAVDMDDYRSGGRNAMALLVQDPDSSWQGLASGFKSMGIPFRIVEDIEEALQHRVVMVYPALTGANTAPEGLRALAGHVRSGGTLLAFSVLGGGMAELFGFEAAHERPLLRELRFSDQTATEDFADQPSERLLRLGMVDDPGSGYSGVSYEGTRHPPIATFDDDSAAITHNYFDSESGTGHAYALGLDLGHFSLRAHNGRFNQLGDSYVNGYDPGVDSLLRFVAAVYRQGEPDAVLLSPTPEGKDLTVLITHDVDFTRSLANTLSYAQMERDLGVPATYFIQTKYVTDYNDSYFFKPESAGILKALRGYGMEIASHSVSHSNEFSRMQAGSGTERYPDYHPFVKSFDTVFDATILGELRVSKFLLDSLADVDVEAFRPGHLSLPPALPQLLDATGYRYSSSITANQALTHLPYRTMVDRSYTTATQVFEFPVTIEDEQGNLGERLDAALALAERVAEYHGLVNVLIHTDTLDHKFDFLQRFISALLEEAHFDTVSNYGRWWHMREETLVTVSAEGDRRRIELAVASTEPMPGLTLLLPAGWLLEEGPPGSRQSGERLVVPPFTGTVSLYVGTRQATTGR